jgi:hypothetical protein
VEGANTTKSRSFFAAAFVSIPDRHTHSLFVALTGAVIGDGEDGELRRKFS